MSASGHIEAYLSFDGNCRDALNYYKTLFNGEITYIQTWNDMPDMDDADQEGMPADMPDIADDDIMHASLKIGNASLMMSDNPNKNTVFGDSITLTWSHPDEAEVKRVWQAFVADGATVNMDLEPSFFAPLFGSLKDHLGINWQIMRWVDDGDPDIG